MKKWIYIALCLAIISGLTACGDSNQTSGRTGNQPAGVNDVLEAGMAEADKANENSEVQTQNETSADNAVRQNGISDNAPEPTTSSDENNMLSNAEGIDVDLTSLSSTIVYSEVYNMMVDPDAYIGKTIRMGGTYTVYHDENSGNYYFACIIQDATACCAQGMEFTLTDYYSYPDDYPNVGDEIVVTGVFDTYKEGEYMYCTLRDAILD